MESTCDIFMPEDVVIEILSRLPVKSVLRFKSVCKGWYSLIKSSSFSSKHLLNYHNNQKPQVYVYHYSHQTRKRGFTLIPEETLMVHRVLDNTDLNLVLGPVNGLFFLQLYHSAVTLWNPATREFRSVLLHPIRLPSPSSFATHEFGFGFDPLTNEYKIVWIWSTWYEDYHPIDSGCELYTVGNNSWSNIKIVDSVLDFVHLITKGSWTPNKSAYLNGRYYWLADFENGSYHTIVMFDFSTHVFKQMKVPNNTELNPRLQLLVLYGDSLSLIGYNDHHLDMWVMKEGGWTQLFSVTSRFRVIQPLGVWNKSEIFGLDVRRKLVLYNHKTDETRDVVQVDQHYLCWSIYQYKESLVSLNGGDPDKISSIPQKSSNLVCYRRRDNE